MIKQTVVRTYPETWTNPCTALKKKLEEGYIVVGTPVPFYAGNDKNGYEYILQKGEEKK